MRNIQIKPIGQIQKSGEQFLIKIDKIVFGRSGTLEENTLKETKKNLIRILRLQE